MKKIIPSLNGLRAISIFCVLVSHVQLQNLHYAHNPGGQIGVTIFFIISGFLITLLLQREETTTGTVSLRNFYIRRTIRIFPVYYSLLLVYFILQLSGILQIDSTSWLSSITYTKYFFPKTQNIWEVGHLWSLSVEEHFYLIWPIVFFYFKNFRNIFAVIIILIIPIVRFQSDLSIMHLFTRADALMWGCMFALHYDSIAKYVSNKRLLILLIPFFVLVLCLLSKKFIPLQDAMLKERIALALFGSFGTVTNISIGLIIIISIQTQNNLYFKFLNWGPINYIGKLSYSIYIWQQLFFSNSIEPFSKLPINLVCIFIVSIISYHLIELPFLKLKDRFTKIYPKVDSVSSIQ